MAYSQVSILRKASQLLNFQYEVENTISETGKRLEANLQQAMDEVSQVTDWVFATRLIELAPDSTLENTQYGYKYVFKQPNDCVEIIGAYPYYMKKGSTLSNTPLNSYVWGFNYGNTGFLNYRVCPLPFKLISNKILANVNVLLLEYVSNSLDCIPNVNKPWFIELIAYRLAIISGSTIVNSSDHQQLKNEYSQIILPSAINKNCNLKDKADSFSDSGVYPYNQSNRMSY